MDALLRPGIRCLRSRGRSVRRSGRRTRLESRNQGRQGRSGRGDRRDSTGGCCESRWHRGGGIRLPRDKKRVVASQAGKIPVVGWISVDCSDKAFGSQEQLFTVGINELGSNDPGDYLEKMGEQRAYYVVAKTNGKADIVSINETSQQIQQRNSVGFQNIIKQCADCKVHVTNFTFSQVPNPATQIGNRPCSRSRMRLYSSTVSTP